MQEKYFSNEESLACWIYQQTAVVYPQKLLYPALDVSEHNRRKLTLRNLSYPDSEYWQ